MAEDNPYDTLIQGDAANTARTSMMDAVDKNPDTEVKLRGLAKQYQMPVDAIRMDQPFIERKAKLDAVNYDLLARDAPKTIAHLGDPGRAAISHDDVDNLSLFETTINSFKRGVPGLRQIGNAIGFRGDAGLVARVDEASARVAAGLGPNVKPGAVDPFGFLYGMTPAQRAEYRANAMQSAGESATKIAARQAEKNFFPQPSIVADVMAAGKDKDFLPGMRATIGAFMKAPVQFIASMGPESLMTSLPGLVGAIPATILAGPVGGAASIGAGSFFSDYGSSLLDGLGSEGVDIADPKALEAAAQDGELMKRVAARAIAHAAVVGGVDALSVGVAGKMTIPAGFMAKSVPNPAAREVARLAAGVPVQGAFGAAGEAGGEIAAGQKLDPGNILAEFVGEAFGAPAEMMAVGSGQIRARLQAAQVAQQQAPIIKQLTELSAASKVLSRDTATFEAFAQSLTDEGATDLWISPDALAQSGVADQVMALSPEVAEQVRASVDSGADIRIPIVEFMGRMSKEGFAQSLVDHVKTDPQGFSKTEADVYMQEHGDTLNAEVEKVLNLRAGDTEFAASRAAVQADLTDKLNAAGRFTPDVNGAYSTLMANFFATQASRLGVTPEALYQQYTPSIVAESVGGAVLDQSVNLVLDKNGRIVRAPGEGVKANPDQDAFRQALDTGDKAAALESLARIRSAEGRDVTAEDRMVIEQQTAPPTKPAASEALIALRKRVSVLESLKACL